MKILRIAKNILIATSITIFLIVMLDIAVRVYLCVKNKDTRFLKFNPTIAQRIEFPLPEKENFGAYYKFKPGIYKCPVGKEIVEYRINSKGFRNREFENRKAKHATRIFCLGASSTMGQNSAYEETYPYILEEILRKKKPSKNIEVINAGLSGYSMEKIYNLFRNELVQYEPDIVTVYSAFNDASFTRNLTSKRNSAPLVLHKLLYYRWMLYTVLVEKYSVIRHKNPVPVFARGRWRPIDSYRKNLQNLITLAKENGIDVVLIKQPISVDIAIDYSKETKETLNKRIKRSVSMKEIRALTQAMLVKETEHIGRLNELKVVDPISEFKKKKVYFIDEVHLTGKGNLKLADIIAREVR